MAFEQRSCQDKEAENQWIFRNEGFLITRKNVAAGKFLLAGEGGDLDT
ncbi:MAG TPA: hypothetical protein VKH64_17835 [Candidatus Binatia bacterium]|nr:hypothetical protein [Candidatus Binatia bacterium]